ncbi:ATP-binding protein [Azohydromonas aeria]|uniref:ATP-binding protein n=1 Tax=Azohydromonas aeria TaxID=2590212 RepID=UPI0012FCCA0D|nr:ATP-binding protein [Azohydromonas aeria]
MPMRKARRSLFVRNVLLLAMVIALAELTVFLSFIGMVVKPRSERIAEVLAQTYTGLRSGLHDLSPAQRRALVDHFNAGGEDQAATALAPPVPWLHPWLKAMEQRYHRTLLAYLAEAGLPATLSERAGGVQELHLDLVVEDQTYRLRAGGVVPMVAPLQDWLMLVAVAALLFALLGAWLIQGWISRPLRGLVEAAREIGAGRQPAPLPEEGPDEIAIVARSFNRMSADLARINEDRALMLAGLSHDLRTPLAKQRLVAEIAAGQMEPELARSMVNSVKSMDRLVGQFLDFTRASAQEPPMACDLDELAQRALQGCTRPHVVRLAQGAGPAPRLLHAPALERAVINLVENALRHGRGPVELATGAGEGVAWVEVRDRGPGIAPEQVEMLKRPFQRGPEAGAGGAGSGLGLSIVERVAQAHGGCLELLPRPGGGLVARLAWPDTVVAAG